VTEGRFFGFLLFFLGSMLGICLAEHMFTLFLFWELTSISSFFLIGFWFDDEKSRAGALKALVVTASGGLIMFAGMALLGTKTNLWTWTQLAAVAPSLIHEPWMVWAFILILFGVLTKSAQFPYHFWLPDAMRAPTPVSAFLHSATMVKAGIILLFRIYPIFSQHPLWFPVVTFFGMTTVVVGAVLALKHTDLKAILAYTTISQLGLFVVMLGYSSVMEVLRAGLIFHIFVHAFYKGSLFMFAGIIDHTTHTRDIRKLGGLSKTMPITCFFMILSACSLAGLPPFLGFLSKESALESSIHMAHAFHGFSWMLPIAFTISAMVTVAVAAKISLGVFFFPPKNSNPPQENKPHRPSWGFLLAPALLSIFGLAFGLFPNLLASLLYPVGMIGLAGYDIPHFSLWHGFSLPLVLSGLAILGGGILFWFRDPVQIFHEKCKLGWNSNTLYDKKWAFMMDKAEKITQFFQNGSLTRYVGVTLGFISLVLFFSFIKKLDWSLFTVDLSHLSSHETLVAFGMAAGSLLVVILKDRIGRLICLGGVGLLMCIYFVLRGAPDLALTGFLIEMIMFILILIVFNQLKEEEIPQAKFFSWLKLFVAGLGGLSIGILSFVTLKNPLAPSISPYFLKTSSTLAGGLNVVNVILVDFRGFDTMGEISVLCLAGLGVYALRKIWSVKREKAPSPLELKMKPLPPSQILDTVSGWIFPFVLLFSLYIVFRGHNYPGGGFIGGLITAGVLILELLVVGQNRFFKIFPIQGKLLFGVGLTLAFLTGLVPLFLGYPFLTSYLFHSLHFSTSTFFDLGVYLVVVGVTLEIIVLMEDPEGWTA